MINLLDIEYLFCDKKGELISALLFRKLQILLLNHLLAKAGRGVAPPKLIHVPVVDWSVPTTGLYRVEVGGFRVLTGLLL